MYRNFKIVPQIIFGRGSFNQLGDILEAKRVAPDSYMVFVLDKESKAALRPVQLGDWVGSDWMVLGGLAAGDRVIVDNLLKLRPGSAVSPLAPSPTPAQGKPAASDAAKSAAPGAPAK